MADKNTVQSFLESIRVAKSALDASEKWALMIAEEEGVELDSIKHKVSTAKLEVAEYEDEKVIEGLFDGQNMSGSDGKTYPVPANYASKSKLVEGDKLKLIIKPSGSFIFKQIELIPRKMVTGKVIMDGGQYQILGENGQLYEVLYASITFYRANVGDNVAVLVPEEGEAKWAAMENVIPQLEATA